LADRRLAFARWLVRTGRLDEWFLPETVAPDGIP
jgi:hypothetical protein